MILRPVRTFNLLLAIAVAVALTAPGCAQEGSPIAQEGSPIAIGPYVQNVSEEFATICWATDAGQVKWGPAGGETTTSGGYEFHSVLLPDLEPGTTYTYDVLMDGSSAGKGTFTTFPEGEHSFRFVAFGDNRNRHDVHRQVVALIMADKPDLVLNTGDLVRRGNQIKDWEAFFEVSTDLMRNVPYYPALGNHERDAQLYFDFFSLPGNERYYSFNRGAVHFVALDSDGPRIQETYGAVTDAQKEGFARRKQRYFERQLEWLKQDLAGHQDFKYVFVFFHHPLYSVKASRQAGAERVREMFGSIFQDYNVSAAFHGHDHYYHRAVAGGVQFVTTGGGGAPLYDIDAPLPESVKWAKIEHFVRVDVAAGRASARVIDINGETIDEFEILPRAVAPAAAR